MGMIPLRSRSGSWTRGRAGSTWSTWIVRSAPGPTPTSLSALVRPTLGLELRCNSAGGFGRMDLVRSAVEIGAARVVIGTAAAMNPRFYPGCDNGSGTRADWPWRSTSGASTSRCGGGPRRPAGGPTTWRGMSSGRASTRWCIPISIETACLADPTSPAPPHSRPSEPGSSRAVGSPAWPTSRTPAPRGWRASSWAGRCTRGA